MDWEGKFKAFSIWSLIKRVLRARLPVILIMHPWHPSAEYRITLQDPFRCFSLQLAVIFHAQSRTGAMYSEASKLTSISFIWKVFLSVGVPSVEHQKYVTFHKQWGSSGFGVFVQPLLIFHSKWKIKKKRKETTLRSKVISWPVFSDTYQRLETCFQLIRPWKRWTGGEEWWSVHTHKYWAETWFKCLLILQGNISVGGKKNQKKKKHPALCSFTCQGMGRRHLSIWILLSVSRCCTQVL